MGLRKGMRAQACEIKELGGGGNRACGGWCWGGWAGVGVGVLQGWDGGTTVVGRIRELAAKHGDAERAEGQRRRWWRRRMVVVAGTERWRSGAEADRSGGGRRWSEGRRKQSFLRENRRKELFFPFFFPFSFFFIFFLLFFCPGLSLIFPGPSARVGFPFTERERERGGEMGRHGGDGLQRRTGVCGRSRSGRNSADECSEAAASADGRVLWCLAVVAAGAGTGASDGRLGGEVEKWRRAGAGAADSHGVGALGSLRRGGGGTDIERAGRWRGGGSCGRWRGGGEMGVLRVKAAVVVWGGRRRGWDQTLFTVMERFFFFLLLSFFSFFFALSFFCFSLFFSLFFFSLFFSFWNGSGLLTGIKTRPYPLANLKPRRFWDAAPRFTPAVEVEGVLTNSWMGKRRLICNTLGPDALAQRESTGSDTKLMTDGCLEALIPI